jgi:hypothetical protein
MYALTTGIAYSRRLYFTMEVVALGSLVASFHIPYELKRPTQERSACIKGHDNGFTGSA